MVGKGPVQLGTKEYCKLVKPYSHLDAKIGVDLREAAAADSTSMIGMLRFVAYESIMDGRSRSTSIADQRLEKSAHEKYVNDHAMLVKPKSVFAGNIEYSAVGQSLPLYLDPANPAPVQKTAQNL